jgi:hypothetical protein
MFQILIFLASIHKYKAGAAVILSGFLEHRCVSYADPGIVPNFDA